MEDLGALAKGLTERASALKKLSSALRPLANAKLAQDQAKLARELTKIEKKALGIAGAEAEARDALANVREVIEERRRHVRESLLRDLQRACEQRGLSIRAVRREEPIEVRIPPLGVVLDRAKGKAEVRFARLPLTTCSTDVDEILAAYDSSLAELDQRMDPVGFHAACRKAWSAARGAGEAGGGDRVEIGDFLPYLATTLQKRSFRLDPTAKNYRGYSRARFAWDVLRLRRAGKLTCDGWRLNLGVATGTTASQKNRSLWFEDEEGDGEYKLTVFFTRVEQPS